MENGSKPIIPIPDMNTHLSDCYGLTKREYMVTMAMQGILAAQVNTGFREPKDVAERAVKQADELLKQLEK